MGRLNPLRETKLRSKDGDRERETREEVMKRRKLLARKRRRRDRVERRPLRQAKHGIEHVRVDGRLQLPRTTYERWRWMARTESDGRSMF